MDPAARRRAEARRGSPEQWPVRAYALGTEPLVDPLDRSTADERVAAMWPLARAAWSLAGKALPTYERKDAPGRVLRRGTPA